MRNSVRVVSSVLVAAIAALAVWMIVTPAARAEIDVGTVSAADDWLDPVPLMTPVGALGDELFVNPIRKIKDPSCKTPCAPFVRGPHGQLCGFVGCFTLSGACAYRC